MLLHYEKPNVFTIPTGDGAFSTIIPGTNKIPDSVWALIRNHPGIQKKLSSGFLKIVTEGDPQEGAEENDLSAMNAQLAIETINGTYNEKLLGEWASVEKRSSVLKAINKQLKAIYVPSKDEKAISV